ncbi:MAG: calcineurin-like phosphoesterase family protein [Planctomycetota bacterium]
MARGVVFEDTNQNRQRDGSEKGISGIRVSNGTQIVTTDAQGEYEIPVDDDEIIFVIKPRNWMTPLSENQLPQFYYIHKPAGSPAKYRFPGVDPTGPLPESIDFPLYRQEEPDKFKAILFGDPQPRNIKEVEYIAHDVVEQIIAADAHDASFGVTLGDIVFDDLAMMSPLNQAIALIGIPWYNVIGNHDLNVEAKEDDQSDETFERFYGPSYYSFDYGPTHFIVLDNVVWRGAEGERKAGYRAGLGEDQLNFIRNDLADVPKDKLLMLMMHIPLNQMDDRQQLYRLIEDRPATVSISAHTHYMEHRLIGSEDGWKGPERHHHIVNVTVCGSWWRGKRDERGIPHATMSDGGPNGYSIMTFDGNQYALEMRAASRPADYQMNIYAPEKAAQAELAATVVMANVFIGSETSKVSMRVGESDWVSMQRVRLKDPAYLAEKSREEKLKDRDWSNLPGAHTTPHIWRGMLPPGLSVGTHKIQVKAKHADGVEHIDQRIIRVE